MPFDHCLHSSLKNVFQECHISAEYLFPHLLVYRQNDYFFSKPKSECAENGKGNFLSHYYNKKSFDEH